jgi:hypothetical protein
MVDGKHLAPLSFPLEADLNSTYIWYHGLRAYSLGTRWYQICRGTNPVHGTSHENIYDRQWWIKRAALLLNKTQLAICLPNERLLGIGLPSHFSSLQASCAWGPMTCAPQTLRVIHNVSKGYHVITLDGHRQA